MDVWELSPEVLGSLWLMASATWGGGIVLAEGLHDWGRRAAPLLKYTMAFALQLRKSTEKLRVAEQLDTTRCANLAAFLGTASTGLLSISAPRLPVGDFSQPLVGRSAFQVAELRVSRIG
jgi:hypothetical protein